MTDDGNHTLTELELKTVEQAAKRQNVIIERDKKIYSSAELALLGVFRETYSTEEVAQKGLLSDGIVTCFDDISNRAVSELTVQAPFGSGITKWQLPIDLDGFRIMLTKFPPKTKVMPHLHPSATDHPRGGFRLIVKGSITFDGKKYGPGDWFFIPNGIIYSFCTDPEMETLEAYSYGYDGHGKNRFSSPIASDTP